MRLGDAQAMYEAEYGHGEWDIAGDPVSPEAVAEYRAALAEAAYAGSCPWGYGPCYHGRLCNEEAGEGWYEGSAGCAYTTPPR